MSKHFIYSLVVIACLAGAFTIYYNYSLMTNEAYVESDYYLVRAAVHHKTTAPVGMANPASVYCVDKGGKLEIRTDKDGGQYGVCILPSGNECEEWKFFRGECK